MRKAKFSLEGAHKVRGVAEQCSESTLEYLGDGPLEIVVTATKVTEEEVQDAEDKENQRLLEIKQLGRWP